MKITFKRYTINFKFLLVSLYINNILEQPFFIFIYIFQIEVRAMTY